MKRFIYGAMIALTATAFLSSCEKEKPAEPVTLNAPTLAVVDQTETSFMVIWEVVENAVSYTYTINDGAEESTVNQSAEFTDLAAGTYTVKVKAIAPEGDEYLDSQWASIDVTLGSTEPEPEQLAKPELSISSQDETSFVIEWGEVANAESYAYTLNGGEETATAELSAEFTDLTAGDYTVKVKAVGDGENYLDSDWASINVTIESGDEPDPEPGTDELVGQYAANVATDKGDVQVVYEITKEGDEYRVWPLTYLSGNSAYYTAVREGNTLKVSLDGIQVNVSGMGTVSTIMCAYHSNPADGKTYLWPSENCELEFDGTSFVAVNGIFLGFQSGGSWYNWTGSVQAEGTKFVKGEYDTSSTAVSAGAAAVSSAAFNGVLAR